MTCRCRQCEARLGRTGDHAVCSPSGRSRPSVGCPAAGSGTGSGTAGDEGRCRCRIRRCRCRIGGCETERDPGCRTHQRDGRDPSTSSGRQQLPYPSLRTRNGLWRACWFVIVHDGTPRTPAATNGCGRFLVPPSSRVDLCLPLCAVEDFFKIAPAWPHERRAAATGDDGAKHIRRSRRVTFGPTQVPRVTSLQVVRPPQTGYARQLIS
jgi:hypothetical protein